MLSRKANLVIFILQLRLRPLTPTPNSLGIIPVKRPARLGMIQARPVLVIARNQQRHTKRSGHDALLSIGALAEAEGKIANGLGAGLDAEVLVVVEGVGLALYAGVLDHGAGVGLEARHCAADVAVDLDDLLDGGGLEEGGGDALFDAEDDTGGGGDADGG